LYSEPLPHVFEHFCARCRGGGQRTQRRRAGRTSGGGQRQQQQQEQQQEQQDPQQEQQQQDPQQDQQQPDQQQPDRQQQHRAAAAGPAAERRVGAVSSRRGAGLGRGSGGAAAGRTPRVHLPRQSTWNVVGLTSPLAARFTGCDAASAGFVWPSTTTAVAATPKTSEISTMPNPFTLFAGM